MFILDLESFIYKINLINKINKEDKMSEIIEIGKVSSRGQICIPNNIREEMNLEEGNKVLFVLQDNSLLMKKVTSETFANITKPLKEEAKRIGFKESEVNNIVHKFRKEKR